MPIDVKIPSIGESITEVQIAEWLKHEGDTVKKDETIAIIDSEKSTLELPSPENGTLTKIFHAAGDTIKIGEIIAQIETNGAPKSKPVESKTAEKSEPAAETESKAKPGTGKTASRTTTSSMEKLEGTLNREDAKVEEPPSGIKTPTATSSQVSNPVPEPSKQPEKKSSTAKTSGREEEIIPMTMLRRTIARRLVEAQQQMAMLTTFNEVDVSAIQALRKEHQEAFEKRYQIKLGFMSFFVKAAIDALKQFPAINAEVRGSDIAYRNYFDIGVAISTERGLVVPVLRNAERMSFAETERAIATFAQRARKGEIKPDELEGGTFSITNGGVFGSLLSTPIINPPQSGILGMHTIQERPVAIHGQITIRPMMYIALTYDHRIVDGRDAVQFLVRIKEAIEKPVRMLVEI